MASSIAASTASLTDRVGELVGAHAELFGCEVDPVERAQRVAHRVVATVAHVVDQRADRLAQVGVEDVVEPAARTAPTRAASSIVAHRCRRITLTACDATGASPLAARRVPAAPDYR